MSAHRLSSLCVLLVCLGALPASADDELARRVATLRALVQPEHARSLRASPREEPVRCRSSAWWRTSEYGLRTRIRTAIRDASLRFALDPDLVRSVIRHESNGDPEAVSHKGAMGLMQLMPATAAELGVVCPFDPRENVLGGSRYLRQMYDRMGSWARALAAYNAGPHRIESGHLPRETRIYVDRILRTWKGTPAPDF